MNNDMSTADDGDGRVDRYEFDQAWWHQWLCQVEFGGQRQRERQRQRQRQIGIVWWPCSWQWDDMEGWTDFLLPQSSHSSTQKGVFKRFLLIPQHKKGFQKISLTQRGVSKYFFTTKGGFKRFLYHKRGFQKISLPQNSSQRRAKSSSSLALSVSKVPKYTIQPNFKVLNSKKIYQ